MQSTFNKSQTEQLAQHTVQQRDQTPRQREYLPISDVERESMRSFGIAALILIITTMCAITLRWLIGD